MNSKTIVVKEIPSNQKYWFFRTEGGSYYPDFYLNGYIALGYDVFNNLSELSDMLSEDEKNKLKDKLKKNYPDEKREGLAVNQMLLFVNTMKEGDIVLIPSASGTNLAIGRITSKAYIAPQIDNEEDDDFLDDDERGYKLCPYLKRRNIEWITILKKNNLDPHLFKLIMCARNTITDASNYGVYIDRNLYPIYLKDGKMYLTLRVEQTQGISALDMSNLLHSSLTLLSNFDTPEVKEGLDTLEVKMMVESPGVVQFIGKAAAISMLCGIISMVAFGAEMQFEVLGQTYSIKTDGAVQKYITYLEEQNRHNEAVLVEQNKHELEMQKQADELKKALEQLKVKAPELDK